jgi:alkylhydroperoxidase family enzyme
VTQPQIDAIQDIENGPFSPAERAVLRLAEQMELTNLNGYLHPQLYEALKSHFDDGQIFELGMITAILAGMAKFLFVFDLVTKEPYCPIGSPEEST